MRKCPYCKHKIKNDDRFCPHCGRPLKAQNKSRLFILYIIVFISFFTIPFGYAWLLRDAKQNNVNDINQNDEAIQLEAYKDQPPTMIVNQVTTLDDFSAQYTNVDKYVKNIENYEKGWEDKFNKDMQKEYTIQVLDNNDVYFLLQYEVQYSDNITIRIERRYDRQGTKDNETVVIDKENIHDFDGLFLTKNEVKDLSKIFDLESAIELENQFKTRKDEFEKKSENIGHYGIGEYNDNDSYVVYNKKEAFDVKITLKNEQSDSLVN